MVKKYEVGDHVVIDESNIDRYCDVFAGKTGVITNFIERDIVTNNYPYQIKIDGEGCNIWCKVRDYVKEQKYKIGERVIVEKSNIEGLYTAANKTGVVLRYNATTDHYLVKFDDGYKIWCDVKGYAPVDSKIVITHDGKTTTAKLYENGEEVKKAIAKCCPEDTFDFNVGAKLAIERLTAKEEPPKPKYYSGKVVCVKSAFPIYWTVGKVYNIVDGRVHDNTSDRGFMINTIADTRHMGDPHNEFIPFVED